MRFQKSCQTKKSGYWGWPGRGGKKADCPTRNFHRHIRIHSTFCTLFVEKTVETEAPQYTVFSARTSQSDIAREYEAHTHLLYILSALMLLGPCYTGAETPSGLWKVAGKITVPDNKGRLHACSANGVSYIANNVSLLSSRDNGSTWKEERFPVETVTIVFCNQHILIAGNISDLRVSRDGGLTWLQTTGIDTPQWTMDPVFARCGEKTFAGISQIGDMINTPDSGVLYLLREQTWIPYADWKRGPVYQLHCSEHGLFLGDDTNIEIVKLDDSPVSWQVTLNDGLRVPCPMYRFGCDIGRSEPFLTTPDGIFLFTGWAIFKFRKNLTGWDNTGTTIPDSFYADEVIHCKNQIYLTGKKGLFQVNFQAPPNMEIIPVDGPPGSGRSYWSSNGDLLSINSAGEIYRHQCN